MEILSFFAGTAFFYTRSIYALAAPFVLIFLNGKARCLLFFILAFTWAWLHQLLIAEYNMPAKQVIANALIRGKVNSIPVTTEDRHQFYFQIEEFNGKLAKAQILLSCYSKCPVVHGGERWQFRVKLKRPRNLGNPGAFDFERLMQGRHIGWTGYIRGREKELLQRTNHSDVLTRFRETLADKLAEQIKNPQVLGVIQALTLGITSRVDASLWDLFRKTGTTHLMVISGAHIGFIAGLVFFVTRFFWRRSARLSIKLPAPQAAACLAILGACAYALLAGMALSAQRAIIASIFLLSPNIIYRRFTGWQAWRYGLLVVLLFEPHAVLQAGFYFSFLAVAVLLTAGQAIDGRWFFKLVSLQLACLLCLLPLTLYWFSYGAVNGVLANLVAVPLVGYVIVPMALLSLLLLPLAGMPLLVKVLSLSVTGLIAILHWVDGFFWLNPEVYLQQPTTLVALMLAVFMLIFLPQRAVLTSTLVLLLACASPPIGRPSPESFRVSVLDVGQGLAVVVQTQKHALVYDTGAKFFRGNDMGAMAVVPFVKSQHLRALDAVVISHPDLDHRGGLNTIETRYKVQSLLVNDTGFYKRGNNCHTTAPWVWDGVSFRFFSLQALSASRNNASCILQISSHTGTILLTGDIEKEAEAYLLKQYARFLKSDALLIAHHGSKTSSTPAFIAAVKPRFAIISAGFDNRYRFPHVKTLRTLTKAGSAIYNTIDCGMVSWLSNEAFPSCFKSQNMIKK